MSSGSPLLISLGPVGPSEANVQNDRPSLMRPATHLLRFDVVVFMVFAVTGVGIHKHNAGVQEILSHTSDYNSSVS